MFDSTLRKFLTLSHKELWLQRARLTPMAVSLHADFVARMAPEITEGCREYWQFYADLLERAYDDPDAFHINAGELEAYLDGRNANVVHRKYKSAFETQRTRTTKYARIYAQLLLALGRWGTRQGNALVLDQKEIAQMEARYGDLQDKTHPATWRDRITAMSAVGLYCAESDSNMTVTSVQYPHMLQALHAFARACPDTETYDEFNFCNCEFRQLLGYYTPTYDDVVRVLDAEDRAIIDGIHTYALEQGLKVAISTYWKVYYKHKSKTVMVIDSQSGPNSKDSCVRVWECYQNDQGAMIAALGAEAQKFFLRRLGYCTACSTSHLGAFRVYFGHRKRTCGLGGGIRVTRPSVEEAQLIRQFIDIRRIVVERYKLAKAK